MADKRKALSSTTGIKDKATRRFLDAAKEIIDVGEGVRGNPLDRKLTLRDLVDSGFAVLKGYTAGRYITPGMINPGTGIVDQNILNLTPPPKPENVYVQSGVDIVFIGWDLPSSSYSYHDHANIYRSTEDNFSNATIYTQATGKLYADTVPYEVLDTELGTFRGYYYWVTFVSKAGVEGPPNNVNGTYGAPVISPTWMLEQLQNRITSSQLHADLQAPIALITADDTVSGSVAQRISSAINTATSVRLVAEEIIAETVAQVSTTVNGHTATIQEQSNSIDGISASYVMKFNVGGQSTGWGAIADETGTHVEFLTSSTTWVDAATGKVAFGVVGGQTVIDMLFAKTASIQDAAIYNLSVNKVTGTSGDFVQFYADTLIVTSAHIDDTIQSTGYSASAGWKIWKSGRAEFHNLFASNAYIRGDVEATSLNAATGTFSGTMTADAVDAVDTINLRGQAVTIPASAVVSGTKTLGGETYTAVSKLFSSVGKPVFISGHVIIRGMMVNCNIALKRGATTLYSYQVDGVGFDSNPNGSPSYVMAVVPSPIAWKDTPPAGDHIYSIVVTAVGVAKISSRVITLIGVKDI